MKARVADKDELIADLRRRLDRATALMTDQRPVVGRVVGPPRTYEAASWRGADDSTESGGRPRGAA